MLVLQGVEQYWREQGVFVGDAATLERTAAAAGFAVVQLRALAGLACTLAHTNTTHTRSHAANRRSAEPPRDPAEAERPHRAARALIRGEVDEVELQVRAARSTLLTR